MVQKTTTNTNGSVDSLIQDCAAALQKTAAYKLPAALDRRLLWLSENKEKLAEGEREELLALIDFSEDRTVEKLQAKVIFAAIRSDVAPTFRVCAVTMIPAKLREAVVRRAGNRCEYCRLAQDSQVATFPIDHVTPIWLDGPTNLENTALACPRCNAGKWKHAEAPDPQTGQMTPLFNPRTQKWNDHFRWSADDSTAIEPITAIGRATLALLELNSAQHLAIRSLLRALELHPPP